MNAVDLEADPATIIPLEAARATLMHWWREPIAGICSICVGCWDAWYFGRDAGLSANVDELLIIGGIILIAGSRKLFTGQNGATSPREDKP